MRVYMMALVWIVSAGAAWAQGDPMAQQRCVWSCLYGPGNRDAANPAYHACVQARCVEGFGGGAASPEPAVDPTKQWVARRTTDGIGYAGIDRVRGQSGLYYFCGRGDSFLRVIGIDGGERGMIIEVDGRQFPLQFSPNGANQPETRLPYTSPLIEALRRGNRVRVLSYELGAIVDAPLTGSRRALSQVISGC